MAFHIDLEEHCAAMFALDFSVRAILLVACFVLFEQDLPTKFVFTEFLLEQTVMQAMLFILDLLVAPRGLVDAPESQSAQDFFNQLVRLFFFKLLSTHTDSSMRLGIGLETEGAKEVVALGAIFGIHENSLANAALGLGLARLVFVDHQSLHQFVSFSGLCFLAGTSVGFH